MAGKIFVNYRRDDSAPYALSIAQYLEREFGAANVFLDIDRLRAGERFPKILEERLSVSKGCWLLSVRHGSQKLQKGIGALTTLKIGYDWRFPARLPAGSRNSSASRWRSATQAKRSLMAAASTRWRNRRT